ncbi:MAG: tetratricopeptide repeat protein [Anaerolineae bacterium]|nr:tetratricopeptide repeat protein [Anaerolineae bacterium]
MNPLQRQADQGLLAAYLPLDRRRAIARGANLPEHGRGAVLFADVSGFTPLMEHLALTMGPQKGAEELTLRLNKLFTPLVEEVHRHRGSVISFGGDALTGWFPGKMAASVPRAAACALAMQRSVDRAAPVDLPAGQTAFSMHVGIAAGDVRRFCVGAPPHGLIDVLAGLPLERAVEAQQRAGSGQVAVDAALAEHLPHAALQPLRDEFSLLLASPACAGSSLPLLPPLSLEQARRWLTAALYNRLQAGGGEFAAELRLVTSLFVRFAGLDYARDAQVGQKLAAYVVLIQQLLARYEGHLALVACGDKGNLAHILFGAPIAHEDDPDRAVRFALEFQQAVQATPFICEQRIGVSLGRVYAGVLGSPRRCTYTVLGDEVNVSARLMEAAQPGQLLVTRRIRQAVSGHYLFHALPAVRAKGKEEPIPVFAPTELAERPAEDTAERLIGREQELGAILRRMDRLPEGEGLVLQLVGEAGVGKSALLRALLRLARERGWQTYVGACLSYGQQTPYLPWRSVIRDMFPHAAETEIAHLRRLVEALPAPAGRPGYWLARLPLLAEAMGLEVDDTPLTRSLEGELRRDNTFQLLEALLQQATAGRPTVIVLEDAYWADELSLDLALRIGRGLAEQPLLLALVHRPFTGPPPAAVTALQALPHQVTLTLLPLAQESTLELARERLQSRDLAPALAALLREKTQGNPFFVEEILRALREGGHLVWEEKRITLTGAWETLELPDTIEGVVRARLDRLEEKERLTLKVASVIGRTFRRLLLQEVHPLQPAASTLVHQLAQLGAADFTLLEEAAPKWRYAFCHPILHETTYETLLFVQRRRLHGAIGEALERWRSDDLSRALDLLAYHYARSEKREKAIQYLHLAGEKARREYANQVALDHYSQAIDLLEPEEREQRYNLLAGRERIHNLMGNRDAQQQDLQQMEHLAVQLDDARRQVEVLNRSARWAVDTGAFQQAQEFARRAQQQAERCQDWLAAAEAQKSRGIVHAILGEYGPAIEMFEQSRQACCMANDPVGEASCLGNLGTVHLYRGDAEQARTHYAQALALFQDAAQAWQEARALINLGIADVRLGAYEQALESYQQALLISREIGSAADEELVLNSMGNLLMTLGDLGRAARHFEQALELALRLQDREGEATCRSNLGLLLAYRGEVEQGRRVLREALQQNRDMGRRRGEAHALHHLGVVHVMADQPAEARQPFQQALALREEIGETGNALATSAWLALTEQMLAESGPAQARMKNVVAQLELAGYSGDYPEQEIWWAACQVWQAGGQRHMARQALQKAYQFVQEQARRIMDDELARSYREQVWVNRAIIAAWQEPAANRANFHE